jgi:hypothetical protein
VTAADIRIVLLSAAIGFVSVSALWWAYAMINDADDCERRCGHGQAIMDHVGNCMCAVQE